MTRSHTASILKIYSNIILLYSQKRRVFEIFPAYRVALEMLRYVSL